MIGMAWSRLLAVMVGVALAPLALAQDRTQDRTQTRDPAAHTGEPGVGDQDRIRDRDRLNTILRDDGKLSKSQIDSVSGDVDAYAKRGGNQEQFRAMVRASVGDGCKGACLCEAVRSMNRFMESGFGSEQAGKAVGNIIRDQNRQREQNRVAASDEQRGDQLRERTRERTREMDRERTRDRAGSPGTAGGGSPQGGAAGGGSQGKPGGK
ncbi:MAG TPA: hypothetical protein VFM53_02950 [Anaeromyxobacteraceae bacterium]|nr:hypothetical protein [Anaeromyxobacteraceae bacterium]